MSARIPESGTFPRSSSSLNLKRGSSNTVIPMLNANYSNSLDSLISEDDAKGINKSRKQRCGGVSGLIARAWQRPKLVLLILGLGVTGLWALLHLFWGTSSCAGEECQVSLMVDMVVPPLPKYHDAVFVGHVNADVDSLCSAIVAAHLFGAEAALADGPNTRDVDYVIETLGFARPPSSTDERFKGRSWGLVDFNSHDKLPAGVDPHNIVCVIDHHQILSNAITMATPRLFLIEPVGSTCTALFFLYQKYRAHIPIHIAKCMLAAIVSDTLNLRGPTTTEDDKLAAGALSRRAGITDVTAFAQGLFEAKSSVNTLPANEIVQMDYKRYTLNGKAIGFGVAETLTPDSLLTMKDELVNAVLEAKSARGLDVYLFAIVDMDNLESFHICAAELECTLVQMMFPEATIADRVVRVTGLVSRKKDFVPRLTSVLKPKAVGS